jgi:hypothetical protein
MTNPNPLTDYGRIPTKPTAAGDFMTGAGMIRDTVDPQWREKDKLKLAMTASPELADAMATFTKQNPQQALKILGKPMYEQLSTQKLSPQGELTQQKIALTNDALGRIQGLPEADKNNILQMLGYHELINKTPGQVAADPFIPQQAEANVGATQANTQAVTTATDINQKQEGRVQSEFDYANLGRKRTEEIIKQYGSMDKFLTAVWNDDLSSDDYWSLASSKEGQAVLDQAIKMAGIQVAQERNSVDAMQAANAERRAVKSEMLTRVRALGEARAGIQSAYGTGKKKLKPEAGAQLATTVQGALDTYAAIAGDGTQYTVTYNETPGILESVFGSSNLTPEQRAFAKKYPHLQIFRRDPNSGKMLPPDGQVLKDIGAMENPIPAPTGGAGYDNTSYSSGASRTSASGSGEKKEKPAKQEDYSKEVSSMLGQVDTFSKANIELAANTWDRSSSPKNQAMLQALINKGYVVKQGDRFVAVKGK